jgi:Domain of unknown function (DUF4253)
MSFEEDIWPYIVGFALVSVIYGTMFYMLPFLFRKALGSKPAQNIAKTRVVAATSNIVKPKPVFSFEFREIEGQEAMAAFEAAKTEGKGIPVIIGGAEHYRQGIADSAQYRKSTQDSLRLAEANSDPYPFKSKPRMPRAWEHAGPYPDDGHPFLVKEHPEGFKPIVTLAYIPAASSADLPAHLRLGGWNAVPEAHIMVALFRKWQRDFGAEIVAISLDAIDVRVTRKPTTHEEALVLAREHLKFCATGATIAETAAELMETNWWHFYWD